MPDANLLCIRLPDSAGVSGLLVAPRGPTACYVLAHGAGAGMSHPFMAGVAAQLADRGVATLRFQFPYMEKGARRPDSPRVARATIRAAVAEAARRLPEVPLFAGGKSFGGRMTSEAQAETALPRVVGLVFLGFPLHPAQRPSLDRAQHLGTIQVPMLFVQGARDALARSDLLAQVMADLGDRAHLRCFADADHSFHVPKRSGSSDARVMAELCDTVAAWMARAQRDGSPRAKANPA